jgi:hypothetical protein
MGFSIADRVKETTTTTGTGTITLAGAATGFVTFASVMPVGEFFFYVISGGSEWEVGRGILASSTTFTRDRVFTSSNANALVSFSAGTKDVFLTIPAARITIPGQAWAIANGFALQ